MAGRPAPAAQTCQVANSKLRGTLPFLWIRLLGFPHRARAAATTSSSGSPSHERSRVASASEKPFAAPPPHFLPPALEELSRRERAWRTEYYVSLVIWLVVGACGLGMFLLAFRNRFVVGRQGLGRRNPGALRVLPKMVSDSDSRAARNTTS